MRPDLRQEERGGGGRRRQGGAGATAPCMCSAASHARRCCRSRPPLHCRRFRARALRSWHRHTLCTGCASVRARRCRCRRQPRRRSTTRRSAQVSAPTLPARSRPRSRPPARRLVRQRAQRCVFLAKPCTAHALTPDQWCAALAADAAAERRDAQPVVRDARGGAGSEHATKPISRCHHRQPRLMGHSVPHTHSTLAASQACRRACVRESLSFVVCTSFSALT